MANLSDRVCVVHSLVEELMYSWPFSGMYVGVRELDTLPRVEWPKSDIPGEETPQQQQCRVAEKPDQGDGILGWLPSLTEKKR